MYDVLWVFIQQLWAYAQELWAWIGGILTFLKNFWGYFLQFLTWVGNFAYNALRFIYRGFQALLHLKFSTIWNAIKRGYNRLLSWVHWYQQHVMKPLDDLRKQIYKLYNTFFRPIIQLLETFRTMVRFLSIFDKKLAALLDSKLSWLESKVMWPINQMLKRVNSISSTMRAMLTPLGMLDRVLMLESMRRDVRLIWQVLHNPLGRPQSFMVPPTPRTQTDRNNDFADFVAGRGGVYTDSTDQLTLLFKNLLGGVS